MVQIVMPLWRAIKKQKKSQLKLWFNLSHFQSAVHSRSRFALCVSQFTQFRMPISHPFFANYLFTVSRFTFHRLLIAL